MAYEPETVRKWHKSDQDDIAQRYMWHTSMMWHKGTRGIAGDVEVTWHDL